MVVGGGSPVPRQRPSSGRAISRRGTSRVEPAMSKDYPETAALLRKQAPEILRRWDRRVRREIPASRAQQPLVLQNNLGPLLVEVARGSLPTGATRRDHRRADGVPGPRRPAGHARGVTAWGEVFLEYRLLRQTVLEVLDEERPCPPRSGKSSPMPWSGRCRMR